MTFNPAFSSGMVTKEAMTSRGELPVPTACQPTLSMLMTGLILSSSVMTTAKPPRTVLQNGKTFFDVVFAVHAELCGRTACCDGDGLEGAGFTNEAATMTACAGAAQKPRTSEPVERTVRRSQRWLSRSYRRPFDSYPRRLPQNSRSCIRCRPD